MDILRLWADGLLFRGVHDICGRGQDNFCRLPCFRHLQDHIQRFMAEISRVFFRKKTLQSDRRWWLSVFYSLYIQSFVRRTLNIYGYCQAHGTLQAQCRQHCHTAFNIFTAASAGWDPISWKQESAGHAASGKLEPEDRLNRHITIARTVLKSGEWMECGIDDSFALLREALDVDTYKPHGRRVSGFSGQPLEAIADRDTTLPDKPNSPIPTGESDYYQNDLYDPSGVAGPSFRISPIEYNNSSLDITASIIGAKRRAGSPPEKDEFERRLSSDSSFSFSRNLATADARLDRATPLSSRNSLSSISSAYRGLRLNSAGGSLEASPVGSYSNLLASANDPPSPGWLSARTHEAKLHRDNQFTSSKNITYLCDCCPKKPKEYETKEDLT